ncbi:NAD(P)-dependent oxidoreductase [Salinicola halophilus]|uniref:NAD(P)-dependent oxidoreductase n=1 Tax=Salinicola halophilus TaxID=184065 RepID=UPI000DA1E3F9|nr:NAD(P)-dependent oxidoreductase [Salinicola halophilus]
MKIGFMGLGAMGQAMVSRLLEAGFEVTVWNRSPGPVTTAKANGAAVSESPVKLAKASDVLISMLPDDNAAHEVLVASKALEALGKDRVHVNMATVSVGFARGMQALHQRLGSHYVAAPVLGRPDVAAAGKLNILAAGDAAVLERLQPLFAAMGQKVWPLGESPERANVVKVAANLMLATAIESMGEASALTEAHGVGRDDFLEIVTGTLFAAPAYQGYAKLIREARYEPAGMRMGWGLKDVGLALQASQEGRVPLPFAGVLRDSLLDAMARGDGEKDWAAMAETPFRRANLPR